MDDAFKCITMTVNHGKGTGLENDKAKESHEFNNPMATSCETKEDLVGKGNLVKTNIWRVFQIMLESA